MANSKNGAKPVALITGASGGIGEQLAWEFARHGVDMLLVARSKDKLAKLADALAEKHGVQAHVLAADLARPEGPAQVADAVRQSGATVGFLVNNAGVGLTGPFAETDLSRELAMLQLNVTSLVHLTKLLLPEMVRRHKGRILNVSSTAAFVPGPFMAGYYASKAYVLSHSVALAEELRGTEVTVTALCPGATRTGFEGAAGNDQSRLFRWLSSGDVAGVAREAYRGMMVGKAIVAPGWFAKATVATGGIGPRSVAARLARYLNEAG